MSKLKIDHGVSRIHRTKLQVSIDQAIAEDIELIAKWSNNDTPYIVSQLLRFALAQEEDFQKYKAALVAETSRSTGSIKTVPASAKLVAETSSKSDSISTNRA
ncbi:MAG: hypothetical protein HIU87_11370 [Acidobacteria bacterium]|nr:hypothetical protein [Acidobacteriota bacterium]